MFYPDPLRHHHWRGHAGTEAAMAAARMGQQTLLLTQYRHSGADELQPGDRRYWEGTSGKEVDALGGLMAKAIDQAGIQFRILNATGTGGSLTSSGQIVCSTVRRYVRRWRTNRT